MMYWKVLTRRFCTYALGLALALYLCLTVWLSDIGIDNVFNKFWFAVENTSEAGEIACYYDTIHNTLPELTTVKPSNGIFFLETSCHTTPGIHLTSRQACAVESAAKMNPRMDVYVLFPGPVVDNSSAYIAPVRQLLLYPNVRLRHVSLSTYTQDTPLEEWYRSGTLRSSHWPRSHASDMLRYLTLWKFGGIYLDLDVVVTRSLSELHNFAGAESNEDVAAGVLSFSHFGAGHDMASDCVEDLRRNFRGYDWGYNGPGVITRVLKRTCSTQNVKDMTPTRCRGFTVFPPYVFYPIPWRQWGLYFNETLSKGTMRRIANSHAIHVWNKHSTHANVTVGSNQPYGVIASQYCPRVYSHAGNTF